MSERTPHVTVFSETVWAVTMAGADVTSMLGEAPYAGAVTEVTYTPAEDVTGAATNYRRVALVNRGADGSGTTEIASLAYDAGVNGVAGDEQPLPLSATVASRDVAEGDILAWFSNAMGTGMVDPGGLAQVAISRG